MNYMIGTIPIPVMAEPSVSSLVPSVSSPVPPVPSPVPSVSSPVSSPVPSPVSLIDRLKIIAVDLTALNEFNVELKTPDQWAAAGGKCASPELRAELLACVEALMSQLAAQEALPVVLETLRILARNDFVKAHPPLLDALLALPIELSARALFNMLGLHANRDLCLKSPKFMRIFEMDLAQPALLEQFSCLLARLLVGSDAIVRLRAIPPEYWHRFILALCANRVQGGFTLLRNAAVQDDFVRSLTPADMAALVACTLHEFESDETPAFDNASALLHHLLCNLFGWAAFDKAGAFAILEAFYMRVQGARARILRVLAVRYCYDKYRCPKFADNARKALSWLPEAVAHATALTDGCKIGDQTVDRSQVVACNKCRYCVTTELVYALKLYMSLTEKTGKVFEVLCTALASLFTRAIVEDLFRPIANDASRDRSGDDTTASRADEHRAVSTEMPKGYFASAVWALGTNHVVVEHPVDGNSYTVSLPPELIVALDGNLAKFKDYLLLSRLTVQ